jgi:two-component system, sensor histidine kinase and response regulator
LKPKIIIFTNKLKELLSFILGENENFPFEKRMFISAILIGILTAIVATTAGAFLSSDPVSIFLGILVACLLSIAYHYIRFEGIFEPFIVPIISVSFITIALLWIFGGGIDGPNIMVGFVILILSLTIISDKNKKYFLLFFIAFVIVIYFIQYFKPGAITRYRSVTARWLAYFITTIYASFLIFLIIQFLHKNYTIERNRAEENEKKFRALSENSEDFITRIDREHHHIYVNQAGIRTTGLTAEQLIGRSISETGIYGKKQSELFDNAVEDVFLNKQPQFNQFVVKNKNGTTYYDWRLYPEFNNENDLVSVLGVCRDITVLKESENKLLRLNADKDLFIAILAHDLKNPFNTILGFSELLLEEFQTYDMNTIERQIGYIHSVSQKTYNLLEDLLLWTKSQSGKLEFNPKKIDFVKTCTEIFETARANAHAKNILVNYLFEEEIQVQADENMIKTVLRNLLSNAIKFTNPGGEINIRTQLTPSTLTVIISDNGVGMTSETAENLFLLSHIITTAGTANEKGTGIGLLLCKEFIEKHGGRIWAESVPGKGSEFKFTLPMFTRQITRKIMI